MSGAVNALSDLEPFQRDEGPPPGQAGGAVTSAPAADDAIGAATVVAQRLFDALCLKHRPTAAHSLRVTLGTLVWVGRLGLSERDRQMLELAALVHDVGKLATPDCVLDKQGRLTPEEMALMERCRQSGFDLIGSSLRLAEVNEAVQGARSWFDGSRGSFTGTGSSVAGRILSIADAFDAMTTDQVYRPAMSRDQAIEELWRYAGTQFDPELVRQFSDLANWDPRELQERVERVLATSDALATHDANCGLDSGWPPLELDQPHPVDSTATLPNSLDIKRDDPAEANFANGGSLPRGVLAAATESVRGSFELTAAKLRGFISDEAARVLTVEDGLICIMIDGQRGRLPFGFRRRQVSLRIEIALTEFRRGADDSAGSAHSPVWTRIAIEIGAPNARRREVAEAEEGAKEVLAKLRSYLMASGHRSAVSV